MMTKNKNILRLLSLVCLLISLNVSASPKHEMRGLWVATVFGIDWPSTTGNTEAVATAQKAELIKILDMAARANLNSILLQVRPMADALYQSSYEPWSAYLTGTRGVAPAKGWDPLAFAVEEAHKRGLELHAWINPFRLMKNGPLPDTKADRHAINSGWVLQHKNVAILDPGNADARAHILKVVGEIVEKYDIDGVIFDDYFYPEKFPIPAGVDAKTEANRRRANVNGMIAQVYEMIQSLKPWVRFGVSPAGVAGGNGVAAAEHGLKPPSVGHDWMYNDIYCDPLRWIADENVDYLSPQVYWPMNHATNPFSPLAQWWSEVARHFGRDVFISQNVPSMKAGDAAWREQRAEVADVRRWASKNEVYPGEILYSAAHLSGKKASGLAEQLLENEYAVKALMPPMDWKEVPATPPVKGLKRDHNRLTWYAPSAGRYVVYAVPDGVDAIEALAEDGANFESKYIIGVTYANELEIPLSALRGHWYAVAPYDRYGNEGEAVTLDAPSF